MDCMARVHTTEVVGVVWSAMPWTVTSVEQQATEQDQGKPSTQRPGGGGAYTLT